MNASRRARSDAASLANCIYSKMSAMIRNVQGVEIFVARGCRGDTTA